MSNHATTVEVRVPAERAPAERAAMPTTALLASIVIGAAAYWTALSVLIHRAFHSNGWDLGLINQVVWNSAHGRLFEYSFRSSSYAGDHWQPMLLLLAPVKWLGAGPEGLLVVQAGVLALAVIPLYLAGRAAAGSSAGGLLVALYVIGLAVARAVSFDFHAEALLPLLAFTAMWGLATGRPTVWVASSLAILLVKEDAALVTLTLCWIAWFAFQERRRAAMVAGIALTYGLVVTSIVIPLFRGNELNPFLERYSYLGDTPLEVLFGVITRPDLVIDHLATGDALWAVFLVLAAAGFLPLLAPRLLPALAAVTVVPLLSTLEPQRALDLHYLLAPASVSMALAVVAVRDRVGPSGEMTLGRLRIPQPAWVGAAAVVPVALYLFVSPLPPSLDTDWRRFDMDDHARASARFVDEIPDGAIVSAQAPFVPHLSEREDIFEFPRVLDAEYVLIDAWGPVPTNAQAAGFDECLAVLPRLGFDEVLTESGITLWQRTRAPELVPEVSPACSGQKP